MDEFQLEETQKTIQQTQDRVPHDPNAAARFAEGYTPVGIGEDNTPVEQVNLVRVPEVEVTSPILDDIIPQDVYGSSGDNISFANRNIPEVENTRVDSTTPVRNANVLPNGISGNNDIPDNNRPGDGSPDEVVEPLVVPDSPIPPVEPPVNPPEPPVEPPVNPPEPPVNPPEPPVEPPVNPPEPPVEPPVNPPEPPVNPPEPPVEPPVNPPEPPVEPPVNPPVEPPVNPPEPPVEPPVNPPEPPVEPPVNPPEPPVEPPVNPPEPPVNPPEPPVEPPVNPPEPPVEPPVNPPEPPVNPPEPPVEPPVNPPEPPVEPPVNPPVEPPVNPPEPPVEPPNKGNPGNDKEVGNSPWDGETGASDNPGKGNYQDGQDPEPNQPPGDSKNEGGPNNDSKNPPSTGGNDGNDRGKPENHQDNGWGNGDDDAPGGSLNHNNAENDQSPSGHYDDFIGRFIEENPVDTTQVSYNWEQDNDNFLDYAPEFNPHYDHVPELPNFDIPMDYSDYSM